MSGKTPKFSRRQKTRRMIQKKQHEWLVKSWVNTLREPFITRLKLAFWLIRGENRKKQIVVKSK